MFKPTLRLGSAGTAVRELQSLLNRLPTTLARLAEDGQFGLGTRGRVIEFQQRQQLSDDGVVGPMTWESLLALINTHGAAVLGAIVTPAHESAARSTIVNVAMQQLEAFGGFQPPASLLKPAIAGALCANALTRARQGGAQLAAIFTVAGVNSASKCPIISLQAEQMYQRAHTTAERNILDIPSWCGIFALYCLRVSGLRMSDWPLRWSIGTVQPKDQLRLLDASDAPMPGDIGIKLRHQGAVLNHHFVVIAAHGDTVSSVDGNVGGRQEIQARSYTRKEIRDSGGGFLRPIWDRVLLR
jgi:peptidoglycan hydrolase-like protein with peptidoglycan-binding domain